MTGMQVYGSGKHKFELVGDKLKMILNLNNQTLSYIINGKDNGAVKTLPNFRISRNDEYRFGVSICPGRVIQLS